MSPPPIRALHALHALAQAALGAPDQAHAHAHSAHCSLPTVYFPGSPLLGLLCPDPTLLLDSPPARGP